MGEQDGKDNKDRRDQNHRTTHRASSLLYLLSLPFLP